VKQSIKELDSIASELEEAGLKRFASKVDAVSNSLEVLSSKKQLDNGPDEDADGDD
jgi:hypothetical protein